MNDNELRRLAHAMNDLRPDWPIASLTTFLQRTMQNRTYRDAAVAFAWIATDTKPDGTHASETPKRVLEAGPWWRAATIENPEAQRPDRPRRETQCTRCGGLLPDCACRREHLAATYDDETPATSDDAGRRLQEEIRARRERRQSRTETGEGGTEPACVPGEGDNAQARAALVAAKGNEEESNE